VGVCSVILLRDLLHLTERVGANGLTRSSTFRVDRVCDRPFHSSEVGPNPHCYCFLILGSGKAITVAPDHGICLARKVGVVCAVFHPTNRTRCMEFSAVRLGSDGENWILLDCPD
jgi:hypothetical protein